MSNPLEVQERATAEGMLFGYLEVVCTSMTLDEYEPARRELSGHLLELAAAYEELGLSPVEAMRAAIAKLGPPKQLSEAILAEDTRLVNAPRQLQAVLAGGVVSAVAMSFADYLLWDTGMVHNTSTGLTSLIGGGMGLAAAVFVLRSRWTLLSKATICGLLYGPGMMSLITFLNHRLDYAFTTVCSVSFGFAGVATAVATAKAIAMSKRLDFRATNT